RDQPAIAGGPGIGLVEIDRVIFADRFAVQFDSLFGQRVGNGLARLARDDVVPDLAQIGVFPEIGLEGFGLRHATLPFSAFISAALRNSLYSIINFPDTKIKPGGKPRCPSSSCPISRKLSRSTSTPMRRIPAVCMAT